MRRTKIVCTIGPSSDDLGVLKEMLLAGLNVARLNFSHGTHEEHGRRIELIRRAAGEVGKNVAVMLDTKGPEIRLGVLAEEPVVLREGDLVKITTEDVLGGRDTLPVNYPNLPREVQEGSEILLADGLVALKVLSVGEREVHCRVENGGEITSRKGVNVPGAALNLPAVTEKDVEDIKFGIEQGVDFIAASFVRRADDVLAIRRILEENGSCAGIIAKIENAQAVENLDEIINVADGIMVARGDLGVEIPAEEVPLLQKAIIEKCNRAGKPVVTATQMLESMIHNPRPTRAEASDVANAIFDGTDAVMLSGETAIGKYPVEAVKTMARIAARAEAALNYDEILVKKREFFPAGSVTDAVSYATCATAHQLGAAAIITSTESGYTARMVAKYRPRSLVVAVTPHTAVLRQLALVWGVQPLLCGASSNTDEMLAAAVEVSLSAGVIKGGDLVVMTAGVPAGVRGTTNLMRVHTVGNIIARGTGIGQKAVTGTARVSRTAAEALGKVNPGDVLVVPATGREFIPVMEKAAAVVTEVGGLTSHAAIVCLQFGIPVVVGVEAATSIIPDGEVITVDGQRGLIYSGAAKVL